MFFGVITDCHDGNAVLRQSIRVQHLFGVTPAVIGVRTTLEASGNIVDALDAGYCSEGVLLANVAPRNGQAKQYENGVPFGCAWAGRTLVVATLDAETLSLPHRLGLIERVEALDTGIVMDWAALLEYATDEAARRTVKTQFRSYEFSPSVARWLNDRKAVPARPWAPGTPDRMHAVWHIDNFGNSKTTLLPQDLELIQRESAVLRGLSRYTQLRDVPDNGVPAIVEGSSGYGSDRFLELVVQGGSAAEALGLSVGSRL